MHRRELSKSRSPVELPRQLPTVSLRQNVMRLAGGPVLTTWACVFLMGDFRVGEVVSPCFSGCGRVVGWARLWQC